MLVLVATQGKEGKFNEMALDSMQPLSEHEMAQNLPILRVCNSCQRYQL